MRFAAGADAPPSAYHAPKGSSAAVEVARGAVRGTTDVGYASAFRQWETWCRARGVLALADCDGPEMRRREGDVAEFLAKRFRDGISESGLKTLRSAIRSAHLRNDCATPTNGPLTSQVVAAAKRAGLPPRQANPVTPAIMRVLERKAGIPRLRRRPDELEHLRDVCLLVVAFGYRSHDVLAGDLGRLNAGGVAYDDIQLYDLDRMVEVRFVPGSAELARVDCIYINLAKSKTQEVPAARFVFRAAPLGCRNGRLCPVAAAVRILGRAAGWGRLESDLICQVGQRRGRGQAGQPRPLAWRDGADLVWEAADLTEGVSVGRESKWTMHSLKVGGTTWLRAAGHEEEYANMLFRWSAPDRKMVRYYGKPTLEEMVMLRDQTAAARARYWSMDVTVTRPFRRRRGGG